MPKLLASTTVQWISNMLQSCTLSREKQISQVHHSGWYGDQGDEVVGMVAMGICGRYGDCGDDVAGIKHGKGTSKLKKINIMRGNNPGTSKLKEINIMRGNHTEMYPTLYCFTFFFIRITKNGSKMEILEEIYTH
jgi:hypothetical protein